MAVTSAPGALRVVSGATHDLEDAARFLDLLAGMQAQTANPLHGFFAPGRELVMARAPGRLDLMGGIADYSGALVLQLPLREATFAAVQSDPERRLRIASLSHRAPQRTVFEAPLEALLPEGRPVDYEAIRRRFDADPETRWAAYIAGALPVLARERGALFSQGARILVASDVPEGKGVSSSAALEVAAMQSVAACFGIALEARELAMLCQRVENLVVGAPCGVMDQMTAACGEADRLLTLLCQPAELQPSLSLPADLEVFGIDSGIRHAVSGADYGSVRVAAFMGYRILAQAAGLGVTTTAPQRVAIEDPRWGGYLANVTPSELESGLTRQLPERMRGDVFLDRYGGITDSVTSVEPGREYAVRVSAAHPVYEHFRVRTFAALLQAPQAALRDQLLGELMYQSHASYSACGLGTAGTDRLVELVRDTDPARGILGAKITGGGSGGTVAVLTRRGSESAAAVDRIARRYAEETGREARVFAGSSPGAGAFGVLRVGIAT